ncbi:EF hand domain-containing protein [Luteimonas cucumeris]|uniref:EF hand domain-containing protein n=1 Tax=Luteimonas cucumeris TaxID=985012 RepID=A0A562KUG8_9GAMM|nr:calcium-binding protein [Luteimonas cucumeris]TWH99058.1 EF hand domain-containing protein [Luteimonas cucumeris]
MNRKTLYVAVALTLAAIGTAAAQQSTTAPATGTQPARHAKLDTNNDGAIDRSEAARSERFAARFDQLDRNKDGKLSADERPHRRGHGDHRGDRMMQADKDKDGRISKAEAATDPKFAARFAEMDANKDGYLDRGDRELRRREHRQAWFAGADANKDGKLSKAEMEASAEKRRAEQQRKWQARSAERFQRLDSNHDGSISRDELDAAPQTRH